MQVGDLVKLGYTLEGEPCDDTGIVVSVPKPYSEVEDEYVNVYWQKSGNTRPDFVNDLVPYDSDKGEFIISVEFQQGCM